MDNRQTRRKYLLTLGGTGAIGLAGCSQGDSSQQPTATEAPTSNLGGANFSFEYVSNEQQVIIEFNGGADILAGALQLRSSTDVQTLWAELGSTVAGPEERISNGATAILGASIINWDQPIGRDETIRLVHVGQETPATLGRFTPPESSTLTSTVPPTDTPTSEPTDTPTPEPDTTPPSISAFSISNPSEQDLRLSFESDEQIAAIQVSISGAETVTLSTDNFSEAVSGGIYTYEATYQASSDGNYTATLNEASDGNGNNGADGEAVSLSVDTTAPAISSFSISNTSEQDIQISFISTEPVSTLEVSISGEEDATLTLSDFNETVSGEEYNYEATYQASSGGDYTATLIEASDSDDNDGAGSESASVTLPTDGIVAEDELISRWPFEENFEDGVGDNNATVVEGSPTTGDYSGRTATSFDGDVAMRVSRGEHDELSLLSTDDGPFSISMWVLFDSETGGTLGDQETPSHSLIRNDTGYRLSGGQAEDSDGIDIHFSVSPYGDGGANGYNMPEGDNVVISIGTWHHLTVVCESESFVRIYIDGEIAFEDNSMDGYSEPSSEFWSDVTIGSWYGGNPEYWGSLLDGKLADVRIYESELSDEEISQIYNSS